MGRMRQMSIERVDAVDEPATGARWIIAKRSKQADADKTETPETAELVKAALEALRKDAELTLTDDAAEALNALAVAHDVDGLKLEKDEDEADDPKAEGDEKSEGDSDEDESGEDDETDEGEGDEGDEDADEDGNEPTVEKRLDVIERALEIIVEKLDAKPEPKQKSARRRRTSKQANGQDDLGDSGEPLTKSNGRVSFASILDQ